jgi:hypothetical protein
MPLYHFHLHECGTVIIDEEGLEKPNMKSVREEAVMGARELMASKLMKGKVCLSCHIEVTNAAGEVVYTLPFKKAVAVLGI